MKFCDKLPKLRKDNNLSQDKLAEKLGMSRQAVSKWESGASYPDMATMIEMCKILNCNINDLLDDDAINNEETRKASNTTNNISNWVNDFLKLITKTYNMFCSMTFAEISKCILELFLISIILVIGFNIIGGLLNNVLENILSWLSSDAYKVVHGILGFIYGLVTTICGFIIFIHLFKIRYLDYYVTVEDRNTTKKDIEEPIDENKNFKEDKHGNVIMEKKKEKVIIRDPKHSTYSFMNSLGNVILFCIKAIALFILIGFICSFVAIGFASIYSIILTLDVITFIGIALVGFGSLIINYLVIEVLYRFIFNLNQQFLRYFIMFIISLIIMSFGIAYVTSEISSFDLVEYEAEEFNTTHENILYEDDMILHFMKDSNVEVIYNNELKDSLLIDIISPDGSVCELYNSDYYYNHKHNMYYINCDVDPFKIYNEVIDGLKEKKLYKFHEKHDISIKLNVSEENYLKLLDSYDNR